MRLTGAVTIGGTGGEPQPPTAPANLTVTGHTSTTASLSWTASTSNIGVTGYQVRRSGTIVSTVTGTTATVTGLTAATAYSFTVTAIDAAGNVSAPSNTATVTTDAAPPVNLAAGHPVTATSVNSTFAATNAVDGDANSYWESSNNAFPQSLTVDLGSAQSISRIVVTLPPGWGARNETIAVSGSLNGSSFTTISAAASYAFDPATTNKVTISFPATTTRYLRLTFTANSGWPAGQVSEFQVWAS